MTPRMPLTPHAPVAAEAGAQRLGDEWMRRPKLRRRPARAERVGATGEA